MDPQLLGGAKTQNGVYSTEAGPGAGSYAGSGESVVYPGSVCGAVNVGRKAVND